MGGRICLFKRGKRVVVYAPDHRHYTGTLSGTARGGRLCCVDIDPGTPGDPADVTDAYSTARCIFF